MAIKIKFSEFESSPREILVEGLKALKKGIKSNSNKVKLFEVIDDESEDDQSLMEAIFNPSTRKTYHVNIEKRNYKSSLEGMLKKFEEYEDYENCKECVELLNQING
jgi:hypothetical protein